MVSDGFSSCCKQIGALQGSSQHVFPWLLLIPLQPTPAAIAFSLVFIQLKVLVPPQLPLPELDSSTGVHARAMGAAVEVSPAVGEQPRPACCPGRLWVDSAASIPSARACAPVTAEAEIRSQGHCSACCLSRCDWLHLRPLLKFPA